MNRIVEAQAGELLDFARELFLEYARSLPFPLDYQGFEAEMAALPGKYARPGGCILLAYTSTSSSSGTARDADNAATPHSPQTMPPGLTPVGCVALRPLPQDDRVPAGVCEMKRMYVRPTARGLGLGRALAERVLTEARRAGYRRMHLDTEHTFVAATALYRSLGFREIPRYNDDPMPCTIWMSLEL